MFERFTPPARDAVVLAQDDARARGHDHIGTEHILISLLGQKDTLPVRALGSLGITGEIVGAEVVRLVGTGKAVGTGQIPFTPRATKTLDLAQREAHTLGHDFIGTEHVLLGLARLGEGVAARILARLGAPPRKIALAVMTAMGSSEASQQYVDGFAPTIEPEDSGADL